MDLTIIPSCYSGGSESDIGVLGGNRQGETTNE
jgi:hypothetical protein